MASLKPLAAGALSALAGAMQAWAVQRASQSLAAATLESQQSSGYPVLPSNSLPTPNGFPLTVYAGRGAAAGFSGGLNVGYAVDFVV